MTGTWRHRGTDCSPIFLIGGHPDEGFGLDPRSIDEFIPGATLVELLARLKEGEYLYLVDLTGEPRGTTKLTLLAPAYFELK